MAHPYIDLNVVKYMVETLKCVVCPAQSDLIVLEYMNHLSNRNAIDWDVLDYFYEMVDGDGERIVDFKIKEKEYITLLHKYCHQLGEDERQRFNLLYMIRHLSKGDDNLMFCISDFKQLIERYDLRSILKDDSVNPSVAAHFYEHRPNEIRPDIIQCFDEYRFDINEPINNRTPLQHYCSADNTYIMKRIVRSFIRDDRAFVNVNHRLPGQQGRYMCQILANRLIKDKSMSAHKVIKMMVDTFGVELTNAKKRTHDIWWRFLEGYDSRLPQFTALLSLYIEKEVQPIHLFHSAKDGDKRMQYKLYHVSKVGINMEEEEEKNPDLKLKKNQKKLKLAENYSGRIVYPTEARDSLLRAIKPIGDLGLKSNERPKEIPKSWLHPFTFQEMKETMEQLETIYASCNQSMPGQSFARTLVILDMNTIKEIQELITECGVTNHKGESKTMNDIELDAKKNNILMKYIATNHPSDILSSDIDKMKEYGIDFDHYNDDGFNALHIYCNRSKGLLNENVVRSLTSGGCPINWRKNDDDDNDDASGKNQNGELTPLHVYCKLEGSDLKGFKILVECGADVHLQYKDNTTAIEYLLKSSRNINDAFVAYLVNECKPKVNFNRQLSNGRSLFNLFLSENAQINKDAVIALCNIAGCDANSRDDENDTNSLMSYVTNEKRKFDIDIIKCLVELGANINEPNNDGKYPIQYALEIKYTPLDTLMKYARDMIECGAKLQHILADDPLTIEDHKLYILQQMNNGYEMYNGKWCRIGSWSWTKEDTQSKKVQSAFALDLFGTTKLWINIERQNLMEITQEELIVKYKEFASVTPEHLEEHEEEHEEKEQCKPMHHDVIEEQPELDREP
eukprot:804682_1